MNAVLCGAPNSWSVRSVATCQSNGIQNHVIVRVISRLSERKGTIKAQHVPVDQHVETRNGVDLDFHTGDVGVIYVGRALADISGHAFLKVALNPIPPVVVAGDIQPQTIVPPIRLQPDLQIESIRSRP